MGAIKEMIRCLESYIKLKKLTINVDNNKVIVFRKKKAEQTLKEKAVERLKYFDNQNIILTKETRLIHMSKNQKKEKMKPTKQIWSLEEKSFEGKYEKIVE